jgi:hypothetical protein
MPQLMLKDIPLSFPAIDAPKAFGEGEPAYGAKLVVVPNGEHAAQLDEALDEAAAAKWEKEDWESIVDELIDDNRVCFVKKEYRNKKTRLPYDGFKGMWYLSTRNPSVQPTVLDKFGNVITDPKKIAQLIYSGCRVHAKVEVWAQDNTFGRRLNCTLMGVMFAGDGQRFGGAGAASADDFKGLEASAEEFL